jgi:hypothetical protein
MCDLVTAVMIGSTAVGAAGKLMGGKANADEARYNAAISTENAKLAGIRARDAIVRGQLQEGRILSEGTLVRKEQEAGFAAGNIDHSYGSPLDLILATATQYQIDAATTRTNAEREAEDYEQQQANYKADAKMGKQRASNAMTAGFLGAAGTVLNGGSGILQHMAG